MYRILLIPFRFIHPISHARSISGYFRIYTRSWRSSLLFIVKDIPRIDRYPICTFCIRPLCGRSGYPHRILLLKSTPFPKVTSRLYRIRANLPKYPPLYAFLSRSSSIQLALAFSLFVCRILFSYAVFSSILIPYSIHSFRCQIHPHRTWVIIILLRVVSFILIAGLDHRSFSSLYRIRVSVSPIDSSYPPPHMS